MATKTRGLPKVANYVKNVGKSLAFATLDYAKNNAEGIADFIDTNEDVFKEIYSSAKNYRDTIKKVDRTVKQTSVFQAVDAGLKNFMSDIKTGDFYNKTRYDNSAESILGLDDDEFDFGDDEDYSGDYSDDSSSTDKVIASSADSLNQAIGAAAISQGTAIAEGTNLVIKTSKASTKLIMGQMDRMSASITSGFGSVYTSVNSINDFLAGPMLTHLENSKLYYENSYKLMQDQAAMTQELLEMQRNLYKEQQIEKRPDRLSEAMNYNGMPNIKGYLKIVKGNIGNFLQSTGLGMADMSDMGFNPLMAFAVAPMRLLLDPFVNKALGTKFAETLKSFDKGLSSFFSQMIAKLNSLSKNEFGGPLSILGDIFGIKPNVKDNIDTGRYTKGPVPFDGVTRKTIVEVIPGYLSRIEAALLGNSPDKERHFDHDTGTWKSIDQIEKDFDYTKSRAIASASSDAMDSLEDLFRSIENTNGKKASEKARHNAQRMFAQLFEEGGDFRPGITIDEKGNRVSGKANFGGPTKEDAWKHYNYKRKEDFDAIIQNLPDNVIRELAGKNLRARGELSDMMRDMEVKGGVKLNLFNDAYGDGSGKNARANISQYSGGVGILAASKDKDGKNVFYYLKEILKYITKNYYKGNTEENNNNGPRGRGPSGGRRVRVEATVASESSEGSSDSEGDPETSDDDESINYDEAYEDVRNQKEKEKAEKDKLKEHTAKFGTWIKGKFGDTALGKFINNSTSGVAKILSAPLKYATQLLDKADESMFKLMFGDNEYKTDDGEPIDSVFGYIIYRIKKSFNDLTKSIKDKISEIFKPKWEKYGKPVMDNVKAAGSAAWNRTKEAVNNTFGRGFRAIGSMLSKGNVIDSSDVAGATSSAYGRVVTKRGLTMISPGEIIIPRSFDKREQARDLALEKQEKNRIMNAIGYNAKGNVDTKDYFEFLKKIFNENKEGSKAAKVGAGGVLGAGAGLLAGINPLLGAMAGAGISILQNSDTLKNIVFGKEIVDAEGNKTGQREGGILPKKIQEVFLKYGKDMTDFGIAGGILGLFTPFGVLGGAAIGAGIGYLKNSDKFKQFIFGNEELGKDGLIKKETVDKIKNKIKKSMPNMLIGVGAGILTGPFGLIGNAVLGAGLGMLSTTNKFHDFVFGKSEKGKPRGGLVGAIERGILYPAKDKINEILDSFKGYAKKNILDPMKRFWNPVNQAIKNTIADVGEGIKNFINDRFEKTIGIPIHDFLQEKLFKPITKTIFTVLKAPIAVGKAVVAAPFRALGNFGDAVRRRQINKGKALDETASERLAERETYSSKHKVKNFFNKITGKDKMLDFDTRLADMSEEQITELMNLAGSRLTSKEELARQMGTARDALGKDVSAFFNDKDENGNIRYGRVNYSKVKKMVSKALDSGDIETATKMIDEFNLTDKEKKDLVKIVKDRLEEVNNVKKQQENKDKELSESDEEVKNLLGRTFDGRDDISTIFKNLKAELKNRKKNSSPLENAAEEAQTPEEKATNKFKEAVSTKLDEMKDAAAKAREKIIDGLKLANSYLHHLAYPNERPPEGATSDEAPKANNKGSSPLALPPGSNAATNAVNTVANTPNSDATIMDPKTGNLITSDPDAKENKENEAEREEMDAKEQEEVEETKKTNNILSNLISKLFGGDKKGKKKSTGILGTIGSGFSKLLSFFGIGESTGTVGKIVKGVLGISALGLASQWFKTSIWPKLKESLMGTSSDGEPSFLQKIFNWFGEKFSAVKNWWDAQGGLSGIFCNKILPKLISGFGYAVENIISPLTAVIVKSLPKIAVGIVTGIIKGLKAAVFNETLPGSEGRSASISTDGILKELSTMHTSTSASLASATESGTSFKNGFGSSSSSAYSGGTESVSFDSSSSSTGSTEKAGFLGSTQRTNTVEFDENGNVTTEYKKWNTTDSAASIGAKATGRAFLNGLSGVAKNGSGISKLLQKIPLGKGIGKATSALGLASRGVGAAAKGAGGLFNTASNTGSFLNTFINEGGDAAYQFATSNVFENAVKSSEFYENAAEVAAKGKNKALKTLANFDKTALDNTISAYRAGENIAESAIENVADVDTVTSAMTAVEKAPKSKFAALITNLLEKFSSSKIGAFIMKWAKKLTGTELTKAVLDKTLGKLATKLAEAGAKGAASAVTNVMSTLAGVSPLAIALAVTDFLHGYNNADTILGVAKGDSYEISIPQRIVCGLVHALNQRFLLGIIPTDTLITIVVEFIFPLFGLDTSDLNEARNRATEIMDEWNKEHADDPSQQYDNLEDFNNKDKLLTKAWKGIKSGASSVWNGVKGLFGAGEEVDEETKEQAVDAELETKTTEAATAATEAINQVTATSETKKNSFLDSIKSIGSFIINLEKDNINYVKTGEHIDSVQVSDDDPLKGFKNTIKTIYRVMTFPKVAIAKAFSSVKEKIFDPIVDNFKKAKQAQSNEESKIAKTFTGEVSIFSSDYWKATEDFSDSGIFGPLMKVGSYVTKVLGAPVALVGTGVGYVRKNFDSIAEKFKKSASAAQKDANKVYDTFNGDVSLFSEDYWKSTGDYENTGIFGPIAKVGSYIPRILGAPVALVGSAVGYIKKNFDSIAKKFDKAKEAQRVDNNKVLDTFNGSVSLFSAEYWRASGDYSDTGVFGPLLKVGSYIYRILGAPVAMVGTGVGAIKNSFNSIIDKFKNSAQASQEDANKVAQTFTGETSIFSSDYWTLSGDYSNTGVFGPIMKVGSYIPRIIGAPVALVGTGVGYVRKAIEGLIEEFNQSKEAFSNDSSKILSTFDGDVSIFSSEYWEPSEGYPDTGFVGPAMKVASYIPRVLGAPIALVGTVVGSVKKFIENLKSKIDAANKTKEEDDEKIENALNGELSVFDSKYWQNADHSKEGLFGTIVNIATYIEKALNAPVAIIKSIGEKISGVFDGIKEWFGEKFGSIWEWILGFFTDEDKDEVASELEGDGRSGKGRRRKNKYGLGHRYQKENDISNMPYGDSTIGEAGCGPVAATNLINSMGKNMTVKKAAKYAERHNMTVSGGGTDIRYFSSILDSQGIPNSTTSSKSDAESALRNGNKVVMLGKDSNDNPGAPFGSNPHFVTAVGMDRKGNIIAEDPDLPNSRVAYRKSKMLNSMVSSVIAGKARQNRNRYNKRFGMARPMPDEYGEIYMDPNGNSAKTNNGPTLLGPEAVLNVARSQIGVKENPSGSNTVKYNTAYWNSQGNPWCCAFVWWVFRMAGAGKLFCGGGKAAYCPDVLNYYTSTGQIVSNPLPGDIILFNFGSDRTNHIGIIESVNGNTITTIEGNADNCVERLTYSVNSSKIVAFCRPAYPYEYVDPSEFGDMYDEQDQTDYKSIASNGGEMTGDLTPYQNLGNNSSSTYVGSTSSYGNTISSSTSTNSSTGATSTSSSSTSGLLDALKDLGTNILKSMYGDAYEALFGDSSSSSDTSTSNSTGTTNSTASTGTVQSSNTADIEGTEFIPTDSSTVTGNSNAEKIWNYLKSKGYSDAGTAGIMGNLMMESGLRPNNLQDDYEKSLGYTDDSYTNAVDSGEYTRDKFKGDSAGYGLAQWTYHTLKEGLYDNTVAASKSIGDLVGQLDFLNKEIAGRPTMSDLLKSTEDINKASDYFVDEYERPLYKNYSERQTAAKAFYDQFANRDDNSAVSDIKGAGYTEPEELSEEDKEKIEANAEADNNANPDQATQSEQDESGSDDSITSGSGRKLNTGNAAIALRNQYKQVGQARAIATTQQTASTGQTINYEKFLETIITTLSSIANNTALIDKIITILSENFGIEIDRSDIDSATGESKAKSEAALNRLVNRSTNNTRGVSKLLGNKDTQYIIEAMTAIARE